MTYEKQYDNWTAAQHASMVLRKLEVPFDIATIQSIDSSRRHPAAQRVVEEIGSIEDAWGLNQEGRAHGQKVAGETIRLWSVPKTTALVLRDIVAATQSTDVLEIGTSAGYSTLHLAMGATHVGGKVTTIESFAPKAALAREHFARSGLENVTLLEGDAHDQLNSMAGRRYDFVFLDADKENYGAYFDKLMPLLKVGGLLVADNICDYGHMMEGYLSKVLGTHLPNSRSDTRVKSYLLPIDNGVLVTKKIND